MARPIRASTTRTGCGSCSPRALIMTAYPTISRLALLAIALVAVSSCTRTSAPAPVSVYNEQPAPSAPGMITVGRGDTVYELAQRYNVPMREVIELNRLSPPYALVVGQRLAASNRAVLYGAARRHDVRHFPYASGRHE